MLVMCSTKSRKKINFLLLSLATVLLSIAALSVGTINSSAFSKITKEISAEANFTAAGCFYSISPAGQSFSSAGGVGTFSIMTTPGCPWTAQSLSNWITVTSGASGSGNGTIQFSVSPSSFADRTGRITVAGQVFTVTQTSDCKYTFSPPTLNFPTGGGNGSFTVTASSANCVWSVVSNASWITVTSDNIGNGNGTVSFSVQPNSGAERTGTITVGGRAFTVTQATGCSYSISSTNINIGASAANLSVNVITGTGCTWTAVSNAPFITITSGAAGSGSGTVNFTVAANTGLTRMGTLTIAGQIFTVTQLNGCTYSISPTEANFAAAGGNGSLSVTAGTGCVLFVNSNSDWIRITSAPFSGSGTISYTVQPNIGPARTGTINVNGQIYTITQALGCTYSLSPVNINIPSGGGSGSFNLTTGAGCIWTVASNVSWITITSANSGSGSGTISFTVERNTVGRRTGTLTVGGQGFTVTQTAGNTVRFDFDGDGRADISVYRPEIGSWYVLNSASGFTGTGFGIETDTIVPADYDGDGKTDIAVFRDGVWLLLRSELGFAEIAFGSPTDIPYPADFDGDGRAELAFFRPSVGVWSIYNLVTEETTAFSFGQNGDIPVAADYDGDGITDIAVFRDGVWFIQGSQTGFTTVSFGIASDKPVPADYDGDGKTDLAVFRPEEGVWYIQRSRDGFISTSFGLGTDQPVPADYDGDGKTDIAVYRGGVWFLLRSTAGFLGLTFGEADDTPVPNAYIP